MLLSSLSAASNAVRAAPTSPRLACASPYSVYARDSSGADAVAFAGPSMSGFNPSITAVSLRSSVQSRRALRMRAPG